MSLRKLLAFARKNWLPSALLVISSLALLWFLASTAMQFIYWNDPRHQDETLKGWMTPRYVGMSYDLPRALVIEALELEPKAGRPPRLKDIAADMGVSLEDLTMIIRAVAQEHREGKP